MKGEPMSRRNWTRNELIVAFNLYCKTPFGRIHIRNPEIIALAKALGRSPSAVSWKLANFARLDPMLRARDIAGASHGGKLDAEIWKEFSENWEDLAFESEKLRIELLGTTLSPELRDTFPIGKTREAIIKIRVNQGFFRASVLAAYDCRCCVTGLAVTDLLCASHIIPWSKDINNRTNPRNGLCLNAIHDRAFDRGLITISAEHKVHLSPLLSSTEDAGIEALIRPYEGSTITLPRHFAPDPTFLHYHNQHVFRG